MQMASGWLAQDALMQGFKVQLGKGANIGQERHPAVSFLDHAMSDVISKFGADLLVRRLLLRLAIGR